MPVHVYDPTRIRLDPLRGRTVAVIGYGNQGHAHALNLRDSGCHVIVGQRPGRSAEQAQTDGFAVESVAVSARAADLIILTLPDESAADIYHREIAASIKPGACLGFVHGFNIRFGFIQPPEGNDVVMVAPKGPGTLLRSLFVEGRGLPALVAVHQDATGKAEDLALAWAAGIGAGRAAVIRTDFATETETDLFGEQTVLCGGVTALLQAAFDTLVAAGYPPEFAYLECAHELKQIVDLIYQGGISEMRHKISNTAEYGDLTRGPRMTPPAVKVAMQRVLDEIRSGAFANEWLARYRAKAADFRENLVPDDIKSLEKAGEIVRGWMPWLRPDPSAKKEKAR